MLDGKIFIPVLQPTFPEVLFHIGIPDKTPCRPYFTIIVPDDGKSLTRASRFAYKEVGTYFIYGYADTKTVVDMSQKALWVLMNEPKVPIPDSDRRFLTITDLKSAIDEEHSIFEITIVGSRFVTAINEDTTTPKIMSVSNDAAILKEDESNG